jgi:hypothetical protein
MLICAAINLVFLRGVAGPIPDISQPHSSLLRGSGEILTLLAAGCVSLPSGSASVFFLRWRETFCGRLALAALRASEHMRLLRPPPFEGRRPERNEVGRGTARGSFRMLVSALELRITTN